MGGAHIGEEALHGVLTERETQERTWWMCQLLSLQNLQG